MGRGSWAGAMDQCVSLGSGLSSELSFLCGSLSAKGAEASLPNRPHPWPSVSVGAGLCVLVHAPSLWPPPPHSSELMGSRCMRTCPFAHAFELPGEIIFTRD